MGLRKGQTNNPAGRPKGAKDKVQRCVKESVLTVYEKLGGDDGFYHWACAEPTEFYRLFGKLLPKDVNANVSGGVAIQVISEFTE